MKLQKETILTWDERKWKGSSHCVIIHIAMGLSAIVYLIGCMAIFRVGYGRQGIVIAEHLFKRECLELFDPEIPDRHQIRLILAHQD